MVLKSTVLYVFILYKMVCNDILSSSNLKWR